MRFAIDGRALQTYSAFRGIGRHVRQLIDVFRGDPRCHFIFFSEQGFRPRLERKLFLKAPRRLITWTDHLFLRNLLSRESLSLYHSPAFALPLKPRDIKYVITVHDLTPLKFPRFSSARNRYVFQKIIRSTRRADRVITVSRNTADDLLNAYPELEGRVRIIHNPLDRRIASDRVDDCSLELPDHYIMYCGGADPVKNLETIVRSLSFHTLPLVIAGKMDPGKRKKLLSLVSGRVCQRIFFTGYVADDQLGYLYQKARVFVFPSLYEGFGYPPLEALSWGTPSVVSKLSPIPEVMENSALYIDDPLDPEALAERIRELSEDTELRERLLKSGETVLKSHSMDVFREKVLAVYRELLEVKRG